jgi:hypothetical protein
VKDTIFMLRRTKASWTGLCNARHPARNKIKVHECINTTTKANTLVFGADDWIAVSMPESTKSILHACKFGLYVASSQDTQLLCYITHFLLYRGIPHFTALRKYCVFLQIEDLWQPCAKQVNERHFSNSMCSLRVSVSHSGNSRNISNFSLLLYLLRWSVISNLWC